MAYDNLLFEVSEQIARITFNRPNVLNALNRKTMDELGDCLKKVRADDAIRVLILTGAGEKAFIAGADINELSQQTPVNGREFTLYGQEIIHRLETLENPRSPRSTASRWAAGASWLWRARCASPAATPNWASRR